MVPVLEAKRLLTIVAELLLLTSWWRYSTITVKAVQRLFFLKGECVEIHKTDDFVCICSFLNVFFVSCGVQNICQRVNMGNATTNNATFLKSVGANFMMSLMEKTILPV